MNIQNLQEKSRDGVILIADSDQRLSTSVAQFLHAKGFKTVVADDGKKALAAYARHKPFLIIADVDMSLPDGFLKPYVSNGKTSPFVITTADGPNAETVVKRWPGGAQDFLVKPFALELLHAKIQHLLRKPESGDPITLKLADLHTAVDSITAADDLQSLFDATLNACLGLSGAASGYIELLDASKNQLLMVRKSGEGHRKEASSSIGRVLQWTAAKWVVHHRKSLLIENSGEFTDFFFHVKDVHSAISVPLKVGEKIIGAVTLNRTRHQPAFRSVDLSTLEVAAAAAAGVISKVQKNDSVTRKLEELSLISAYSEKLVGLVDKKDIIKCFFETIRSHFPFDMIGFVLVKRRFHQFLYWSRKKVPSGKLIEITADVVDRYNQKTKQKLMVKRVSPRMFLPSEEGSEILENTFTFSEVIPVAWEDYNFGAAYFAAHEEIGNKSDVIALLSSMINQTCIALTNARLYNDMKENYIRTIKALAIAVDAKDTYTHGHSENVMNIAESIARELSGDEKWIGTIRDAGLLHDIGKIGIPGYILNKPGPLTYEEFNGIMKTHTTLGANIVRDVPFLQELYSLILYHHEHFDGTGYPEGLEGENIPLGARILHVSDAFEAMTSNRPYRNSLGKREAFKRLREQKGKQFDPKIVEIFEHVAIKKGWLERETDKL